MRSTRDCAVGTVALQRPDAAQKGVELRQERRAGLVHRAVAGHDQDVDRRQGGAGTTKCLTRESLDPVPVDGTLGATLGDRQAEPGGIAVVVSEAQKKTAAAEATADCSQRGEVGGAA